MNYRAVDSWHSLTLNDHKRLKEILSRLNSQICSSDDWPFLQRYHTLTIPAGQCVIPNPVNGKINIVCINANEYAYSSDYKSFVLNQPIAGKYSTYAENIYLPRFSEDVTCEILYNTDYSAKNPDGSEKKYLELEDDESLIPEVFQEPILVYGACMRLKSNPDHNKFKYWYSKYNDSLATMRAKTALSSGSSAKIKIERA